MVLRQVSRINVADINAWAWSGLRRFQNTAFVEAVICESHHVPARQRSNARKQAEQIRYCLIQAREYFQAAANVSLATRPVLFYYCIMSLALAEILLKHSGLSSLDKAREMHRHHGLDIRVRFLPKTTDALEQAASAFSAAPLIGGKGERLGTFELWHQSAREMPLGGRVTHRHGGATTTGTHLILEAADRRLPLLPSTGLTLLDCYRSLAGMAPFLGQHQIVPLIVRARLEREIDVAAATATTRLVIHPGDASVHTQFFENMKFAAEAVNRLVVTELPSGVILQWVEDAVSGALNIHLPPGGMWSEDDVHLSPTEVPLNEFGYLYVALFIIGNLARYYPDRWMLDVEQASPLALSAEELLAVAEKRMALLVLSEMTRSYQVPTS